MLYARIFTICTLAHRNCVNEISSPNYTITNDYSVLYHIYIASVINFIQPDDGYISIGRNMLLINYINLIIQLCYDCYILTQLLPQVQIQYLAACVMLQQYHFQPKSEITFRHAGKLPLTTHTHTHTHTNTHTQNSEITNLKRKPNAILKRDGLDKDQ